MSRNVLAWSGQETLIVVNIGLIAPTRPGPLSPHSQSVGCWLLAGWVVSRPETSPVLPGTMWLIQKLNLGGRN